MLAGIFNVLKPPGMTSHDVVYLVRKVTGIKKVGHAGTLDPDAAGVLPVFVGKATRVIEYAAESDKCYRAQLLLGVKTDTGDDSGKIIENKAVPVFTDEDILSVLENFTGNIFQIPPMYSAIKIGGQKLYKLAREGKTVERTARPVTIHSIRTLRREKETVLLEVHCSKGVYVRTLLEDIAEKLGSVGTMSFLLRTRAGSFTIESARLIEEIAKNPARCILPMDIAVGNLPKIYLNDKQAMRFCQGVATTLPNEHVGEICLYSAENVLLGIGMSDGEKIQAKKVLADNLNIHGGAAQDGSIQ